MFILCSYSCCLCFSLGNRLNSTN